MERQKDEFVIMIVDDEDVVRENLKEFLELQGFSSIIAENGEIALKIFENRNIDLVISDLVMPKLDGIGLLKKIKKINADIPVIIMTAYSTVEYSVEAMKAGAFDFIPKPFDFNRVLFIVNKALENRRLVELAKISEHYKKLSNLDGLTEIYNHRYIKELIQREIKRHIRYSGTLCLLMIDIDDFKKVNDTYGHPVGDLVLIKTAELIKKSIRGCDILSRYGGEEFLVALPVTPIEDAKNVAERIIKSFNNHKFIVGKDKKHISISVTIGLSAFPDNSRNKTELIENADKAMYEGKRQGKNRLVVFKDFKTI